MIRAEDDDVPTSLERAEASFPAAEEVRSSAATSRSYKSGSSSQRRKCRIVAGSIVVVALLILLLSLVLRSNGGSGSTSIASVARQVTVESVVEYMVDMEVSNTATFKNKTSPQYRAAQWLAEIDGLNLPVPSPTTKLLDGYFYVFRYVMALTFFANGGEDWTLNLDFLSDTQVCRWNHLNIGVICDKEKEVVVPVELVLRLNKLTNSIPSEFGKLTTLKKIDLSNNKLSGSIPDALCSLAHLQKWIAQDNRLGGEVPDCFGSLSKLLVLTVSNNNLEGTLPQSLEKLKRLELLYIDDNRLTGDPLPVFNALTNLTHLYASGNAFTGNVDSPLFMNSKQIAFVDLSSNNFTCATGLPQHLFERATLTLLDISKNNLAGTLPSTITENSKLEYLSLYGNLLTGSLSGLANLKAMVHLDLSNNRLTGSMDAFASLPKLALAFLSNNPFAEGPVPDGFAALTGLTELSLRNTYRNGTLPSLAPSLFLVDFGSNRFNSTVPESYGSHTNIKYLLLNNNSGIFGSIPSSFRNLTLRGAFLDGTSLDNRTMDTMCQARHFLLTSDDNREVLVGDCTNCTCPGCQCCKPGKGGCAKPILDNLDLTWEAGLRRSHDEFSLWDVESVDADGMIRPRPPN